MGLISCKNSFIEVNPSVRAELDDSFLIDTRMIKSCDCVLAFPVEAAMCRGAAEECEHSLVETPVSSVTTNAHADKGSVTVAASTAETEDIAKAEGAASSPTSNGQTRIDLAKCLPGYSMAGERIMQSQTQLTIGTPCHSCLVMIVPCAYVHPPNSPTEFIRERYVRSIMKNASHSQSQDKLTTHNGESDESTSGPSSSWTTCMIRHIPNDYTRADLVNLLDAHQVKYNFVYLPICWNTRANRGYAFVNMVSPSEAERTTRILDGYSGWKVGSSKVCKVDWALPQHQGLEANIQRFRNSALMHSEVPEEFKPLFFIEGKSTLFPAANRRIKPPKAFKSKP